ncbi:MAG: hypothetical protein WKF77_30250, partial [Planctomycetaceae bacterium]
MRRQDSPQRGQRNHSDARPRQQPLQSRGTEGGGEEFRLGGTDKPRELNSDLCATGFASAGL